VVVGTAPPLGVKVTEFPKPDPEVVDTRKPEGAVTVILAVRSLPLTVKLCSAEGVLAQAVKVVSVVVLTVRVGVATAGASTVKVTGTGALSQPVVLLRTLRLKL
jgi:hypothetical protein